MNSGEGNTIEWFKAFFGIHNRTFADGQSLKCEFSIEDLKYRVASTIYPYLFHFEHSAHIDSSYPHLIGSGKLNHSQPTLEELIL